MHKIHFEKLHPDIIYMTSHRNTNYPEIKFDIFLERTFPGAQLFSDNIDPIRIRQLLKERYNNDYACFKEYGKLIELGFDKMTYYQQGVRINGPNHTDQDEPVNVITLGNKNVLFNGYHRAFIAIIQRQNNIKAYNLIIE